MTIGRYARHTQALLRQETREVAILAQDMYGTAPGAGADPTKGLTGQSIRLRFDPDTRQGICADIKVPNDRVPGTPIKFYFVYSIPTGPGGGNILWRLDYVIVGNGEQVNPTPNVRTVLAPTKAPNIQSKSDPIIIDASEIDGKAEPIEIQLGIIRYADDAGDTETSAADLYKVIMEYTAYV